MLKLVQSWLTPRANPIGVDFGSDCLRMAQVQSVDGDHRLIAAASTDVPSHVRNNTPARILWFAEAARDLLTQGGFKGRSAILSLPASIMYIQHLRLPKTDEATLKKTIPFEARGKLPIDPSQCLLRHAVAGDIFSEQDPRCEVIVMAAAREMVNQLLDSAARARLDIVGMNIEPMALVDCFTHVYRRKTDQEVVNLFVDIGAVGTRAFVAQGGNLLFARNIAIGGDHLTRAVAAATGMGFDEAKLARIQATAQAMPEERVEPRPAEPAPVSTENMFALLPGAASSPIKVSTEAPPPPAPGSVGPSKVEQACIEPLGKLIEELNLCRRYHEATFSNKPVGRLIFIGGEARQRWMCQHIARSMQLAAQVGDPMVRLARTTEIGIESGIDRRQPQPAWAVALGLSMGPVTASGRGNGSVTYNTERAERRGAA